MNRVALEKLINRIDRRVWKLGYRLRDLEDRFNEVFEAPTKLRE